jgi:hypothetical protein
MAAAISASAYGVIAGNAGPPASTAGRRIGVQQRAQRRAAVRPGRRGRGEEDQSPAAWPGTRPASRANTPVRELPHQVSVRLSG